MKAFKGKVLYNPSGKAGEYSYWAANTHYGCKHNCAYCYCKTGVLGHVMGGTVPTLKKCLKNDADAAQQFKKEVIQNMESVKRYGIFFSFTTDPLQEEMWDVTWDMVMFCTENKVPVKILTKRADWAENYVAYLNESNIDNATRKLIAFGFTLTGHDELEPGANTNAERIESMKLLHDSGCITFASIEPVIDFESSKEMIRQTAGYCDLYKIGLLSGKKYDKKQLISFIEWCNDGFVLGEGLGIYKQTNYFKDSLLEQAGIKRDDLPANCVTRKYNIFTGGDECLEICESCEKEFDIEEMHMDSEGNWFCPECWEELAPEMQAEYEELKAKGEIE